MKKILIGALISVMLSLGAMAGNVKHAEDTCPCDVFLKAGNKVKYDSCEKAQDYKYEAEKALDFYNASNLKEAKDAQYKLYRSLYTKYQSIMKKLFN